MPPDQLYTPELPPDGSLIYQPRSASRMQGLGGSLGTEAPAGGGAVPTAQSWSIDLEASTGQGLYIDDASQTGLDLSGDGSLQLWIMPESLPSVGQFYFLAGRWGTVGTWSAERTYQLIMRRWSSSKTRFEIDLSANGSTSDIVQWEIDNPATGTWLHVTTTWDISLSPGSGQNKLYLGGSNHGSPITIADSSVGSLFDSDAHFTYGYNKWGPTGPDEGVYFDGLIDVGRVWSKCLTAGEVAVNWDEWIPGARANLVDNSNMEDGSGADTDDDSGGNNTKTLSGGASWVEDSPIT